MLGSVARKGELKGNAAKKTPVRDVMTEQMFTVNPDTTVDQCMAIMMKHRIHRVRLQDLRGC